MKRLSDTIESCIILVSCWDAQLNRGLVARLHVGGMTYNVEIRGEMCIKYSLEHSYATHFQETIQSLLRAATVLPSSGAHLQGDALGNR